jgi:class 3 adenylate cyclase
VRGIAVHIASRIAALAEPDEVLVSRTVRDLVAGSGLRFDERGRRLLKALTWTLWSVELTRQGATAGVVRAILPLFLRFSQTRFFEHPSILA